MKAAGIVWKEVIDQLRDRRALYSGLAFALMGPVLVFALVHMLAGQARDDRPVATAMCQGAAPNSLHVFLEGQGFAWSKTAGICLDLEPGFEAKLKEGRQALIAIRGDLTANDTTVRRLDMAFRRYAVELSAQRLLARGIAPSITHPLQVVVQNQNAVSRQSDTLARVLILYVVCAPFLLSLSAAADMTAGERERRSLEPLLAHPVDAYTVIGGKWFAAASVSLFGVALTIVVTLVLMSFSPLPELGLRLAADAGAAAAALVMLVPLTGLVTALQLLIGLLSRNYKDAQNYLTMLTLAPIVLGFALSGDALAKWSAWPFAYELYALRQPLLEASVALPSFAQVVAAEAVLTLVILVLAARRLMSEDVLAKG